MKNRLTVDRSKWVALEAVELPPRAIKREGYLVNSAEFKPVEIVGRVYKSSIRRGQRVYEHEDDSIFGIGGYIIRFQDGHEYSVSTSIVGLT